MRKVVTDDQEFLRLWISKRLGGDAPNNMQCIGQEIDGEIKAVAGYAAFEGAACNISLAGDGNNWMNKDFLWAMFDYPFNKLNLKVIIATIAGSNYKSLKLSRNLGFKQIASIADAHENGDLVIMIMRRENCKWLHINAKLKKDFGD